MQKKSNNTARKEKCLRETEQKGEAAWIICKCKKCKGK